MSKPLALSANAAILGFLAFAWWLQASHPHAYYAAAQEDQALEWATFWSFLIAGFVFAAAAFRQRRSENVIPWFVAGLALFCVVVAMEEISWGQRVFGHRPPEYFLAKNYQQELNLHNIVGRELRVWAFRSIALGYGVFLPLLALLPFGGRVLRRLAIVAPPVELAPSMFAVFWLHLHYPWKFTGEIAECALGFSFLFAAMANASDLAETRDANGFIRAAWLPALAIALGFSTAVWSQNRQSDDPTKLADAKAESEALVRDFTELAQRENRESITKCGLHKRIYTYVSGKRHAHALARGAFAKRTDRGMPDARAEYFLDPWNNPYWIRDRCDKKKKRRSVFIYSFGPNRSRDSSRWDILGDDVGAYLLRHSTD